MRLYRIRPTRRKRSTDQFLNQDKGFPGGPGGRGWKRNGQTEPAVQLSLLLPIGSGPKWDRHDAASERHTAHLACSGPVARRNRLARTAGVLRRAAREPERRSRLRRDLKLAWAPTPGPKVPEHSGALPDEAEPAPVRDLRAIVVAESPLATDLAYEWQQTAVTRETWKAALEDAGFVLVTTRALLEWSGTDSEALIAAAKARAIPIVVWDTAAGDTVGRLASSLSGVSALFTVDPQRVSAWTEALTDVRVAALPPGVQPRLYSPVRGHDERGATVGLVVDGPEQVDDSLAPVLKAAQTAGLAVYGSREDATSAYSRKVASTVIGDDTTNTLRPAFRSSSAWIVPTTPDAPLPERVLQLASSATPVVTAPNASVAEAFGELVPGSTEDTLPEAGRAVRAYVRHAELRDRVGLQLQRRVLAVHTTGHRVDALLTGIAPAKPRKQVSAVVPTNRPGQLDHVLSFVGRQDYPSLQLVLVLHGLPDDASLAARAKDAGVQDLVVVNADPALTLGACMNLGVDASDGDVIAKMDDDNIYGAAYLTDLVNAFSYTDAGVVGKWAHYVHLTSTGAVLLRAAQHEHRYVRLVQGGSMVMDGDLVREARFEDVPRAVDTTFLDKVGARGVHIYSADRFNYVSVRRSDASSHTWKVTDLEMLVANDAKLCFYGDPTAHIDV